MGSHGATDLSPVRWGPRSISTLRAPTSASRSTCATRGKRCEVFPHAYSFDNGFMHPGDTPGHGVDFDEALAARYPYKRAYLPVNRKLDGTLWNW